MNYSTIKAAFKNWADYRNIELSDKYLEAIIFYAQAESIEQRAKVLFTYYDDRSIDKHFNWMDIGVEDSKFIVKVFNERHKVSVLDS